jgi:hypothetical protein
MYENSNIVGQMVLLVTVYPPKSIVKEWPIVDVEVMYCTVPFLSNGEVEMHSLKDSSV